MNLFTRLKQFLPLTFTAALLAGCANQLGQVAAPKPLQVLLIGGGASHDYTKWFNLADTALLQSPGRVSVKYVEPQETSAAEIHDTDVLVISANKEFPDAAVRQAVFAHVAAGKGLVLLHPGIWYNWKDWPEFNRVLAGGGARGHDRYAEFTVTVTDSNHPLTRRLPATFTLKDELYWFEQDKEGAAIDVLATAHSPSKNKAFPMIFTVRHPSARIAAIALGHDGDAHEHFAYREVLERAILWSAKRL
jgi:type 1 glutamine amidotransferase